MIWLKLDDRQFYSGDPDPAMDRKLPRLKLLLAVGEMDLGERVTNITATLSTAAMPELDPPPVVAELYSGSDLLFSGSVDTIRGGAGITVTAIA